MIMRARRGLFRFHCVRNVAILPPPVPNVRRPNIFRESSSVPVFLCRL